MGDVLWSVEVAHPSGVERPCLQVGTKRGRNRFEYERSRYQGCVQHSRHLAATEKPLIVTGAQVSAGMQVGPGRRDGLLRSGPSDPGHL